MRRSVHFITCVFAASAAACGSSGGGSGAPIGGIGGNGATGATGATGASGGSGGVATGGSAGAGLGAGGVAGTPGSGGVGIGGAPGSGGSAGSGGTPTATPQTPGCAIWKGNCTSGDTTCSTSLSVSSSCGACGVSCTAAEACIGTTCAQDVNPNALDIGAYYPGKNGLIVTYTDGSERGIAKIGVDSGIVTKVAVLSGTPDGFLCYSPDAAAEGDDGALYLSCSNNQIWLVPAAGGAAKKLIDAGAPNSNNLVNIAVLGSKLFYVGNGGIFRANLDGTGSALWMKNACVSSLAADALSGEVVFSCKYDHTIRVRAANAAPSLDYKYDREIATTGNSGLWIDGTHYWYRRHDKLVGKFYQGALLRVPKQGGGEQTMLDIFAPPALAVHVSGGGAYAAQLIDQTDHHLRLVRVGSNGAPEQLLVDWVYGYQVGAGSLYVGSQSLLVHAQGAFVRVPH